MTDNPFTLANDPPGKASQGPVEPPVEKQRQRVLLAGLDCLPDQRDLFPTDGERE